MLLRKGWRHYRVRRPTEVPKVIIILFTTGNTTKAAELTVCRLHGGWACSRGRGLELWRSSVAVFDAAVWCLGCRRDAACPGSQPALFSLADGVSQLDPIGIWLDSFVHRHNLQEGTQHR